MDRRRQVRNALAALALVVAAGCESSTGVLIEVTRDDSVPRAIGRLVFYIGVAEDGDPLRFIDPEPTEEVRLEGRDIAEDPYRLLMRPLDYGGASLMVAVVAILNNEVVGFGALPGPVAFRDGVVTRWGITLGADLPDGFGVTQTGCLSWVDGSGKLIVIGRADDQDCDGWRPPEDCDDSDPAVNPDGRESCGNDTDDDCDGDTDENVDEDGDQVTTCDGDCDDGNPLVNPGAAEECDGLDNDCDAACDEGHDLDGDLYTPCGSKILDGGATCLFDPDRADCDDKNPAVNPSAAEICDGRDNDCDGTCEDLDAGLDRDGDGYTSCGSIIETCGMRDSFVDCADEDPAVHPGATELCNGIDDDCDGDFLQRGPCFADDDEQAGCFFGGRDCDEEAGGSGTWAGECQALISPFNVAPPEVCEAYLACDEAGEIDPHLCSIVDAGLPAVGCQLVFEVVTGAQCPGDQVALPTDGIVDCSWRVVGGVDHGDLLVGLRAVDLPDDSPQPAVAACGAALVVQSQADVPPSAGTVLLAREGEKGTTYFAVSVVPVPTDTCNRTAGLACGGLPPP